MKRLIVRRGRDDSGAVAVTVAIFVIAFVALSAIVVDVGYMYDTRRQLQAIAESAALAGCQELIATQDAGAADSVARAYANLNTDDGPVDGLTIESVDVDMTEGSVRVVVAQQAPAFFSRMFGPATNDVRAAAKARKWALAGGRYVVPWAIPTIRSIDYVEAAIVDDKGNVISSTNLGETGTFTFGGIVNAPVAPGGYDVRVRIYNSYGIPELLYDSTNVKEAPAGRVTVGGTTFTSVTLSDDYVTLGEGLPVLSVVTAAPEASVSVDVAGKKRVMTTTDDIHWSYAIQAHDVDWEADLLRVYELDVFTGGKGDGVDAYLHVARSTHPIEVITATPGVVAAGGSVAVSVELSEFYPTTAVPGQTYVLRVGSPAGLAGNYGELNFSKLVHTSDCPPDPYDPKAGNNYFDWTAYGYEGGIHLDDVIELSPGTSGINTQKALDERASRLLPGEDLIVAVPVVERYVEKTGGAYDVIVVNFAAFKILSYDKSGGVTGEFQQYIANPSSYEPDPGGDPNAIYAARLVNP